jgi:opacity protein-like surface antigen
MTLASFALVGALAVPAAAQDSVGANLTFLRGDGATGTGFQIDAAKGLTSNVAVVGEIGLNRFDGFNLTSFQGGVRFLPAVQSAVRPFLQALAGVEHCGDDCFDSNFFSFQIGGGVEFPLSDRLNLRAQYDFRRTSADDSSYNANRFGIGVVLPF